MPSPSLLSISYCISVLGCLALASASTPITHPTLYGDVTGVLQDDGLSVFHSIPYAAPPVGDLRFRAPVPPTPWTEPRAVDSIPPACPQFGPDGLVGDEDCLYMHVYVPPSPNDEPLPVVLYIFGGGFQGGDAYLHGLYNASHLAMSHNTIVLVPNYREGVLGYLAHEHLRNEDADGSTGNAGIQDQRMALQWIQDNIKNFGGDPDRVTLWGSSSGGWSSCLHIANGHFDHLFSAAFVQSGNCEFEGMLLPMDEAINRGSSFSHKLGCSKFEDNSERFLRCLRDSSVADIMANQGTPMDPYSTLLPLDVPWAPVRDGRPTGTPEIPIVAMKAGRANKVPFLFGSNLDDGTKFTPPDDHNVTAFLHQWLGNDTDISPILDLYPSGDFESEKARYAVVLRDYIFLCPMRRAAAIMSAQGLPVYLYQFAYNGVWTQQGGWGVFHGAEVIYIFGNTYLHEVLPTYPPLMDVDIEMSDDMELYWTNFVKYHDPNGEGDDAAPGHPWPRYSHETDLHAHLDRPSVPKQHLQQAQCDAFDRYSVAFTS